MSSRRAPRIPEPVPGGRGRQGQAAWLPSSQTLRPPQGDLAVTGLNCCVDVSFQVTPYSDHAPHPAPNWKSEVSDLPSRVKIRGGRRSASGPALLTPSPLPNPHSILHPYPHPRGPGECESQTEMWEVWGGGEVYGGGGLEEAGVPSCFNPEPGGAVQPGGLWLAD